MATLIVFLKRGNGLATDHHGEDEARKIADTINLRAADPAWWATTFTFSGYHIAYGAVQHAEVTP